MRPKPRFRLVPQQEKPTLVPVRSPLVQLLSNVAIAGVTVLLALFLLSVLISFVAAVISGMTTEFH